MEEWSYEDLLMNREEETKMEKKKWLDKSGKK